MSNHLPFSSRTRLPTAIDGLLWLLERLFPWLFLGLLLYYSYALFVLVPYGGVQFSFPFGHVMAVQANGDTLQPGDLVRKVGDVPFEEINRRRPTTYLFKGAEPGEMIPLEIERNGEAKRVMWRFPGISWSEGLRRLSSQWWLTYVFWMGGTFTLLFIRPRDDRWRLLIAFNYLTALWLAAGTVSIPNFGNGRAVFRAAVWLAVPVALHLHWVFPDPLPAWPRWLRRLTYLICALIAVGDLFYLPPAWLYWYGFLLVLGGSAVIILGRLLFGRKQREGLGLLLGAIILVLLPPVVVIGLQLLGWQVPHFIAGGTLLALPAIPGAYFYILYRRQMGRGQARARRLVRIYVGAIVTSIFLLLLFDLVAVTLQFEESPLFVQTLTLLVFGTAATLAFAPFLSLPLLVSSAHQVGREGGGNLRLRANRLLIPFFFIVGAILLVAVALLFGRRLNIHLLIVVIALLTLLWGRLAYRPLERVVDRYLLGIRTRPAHLLERFAERISTTLDRESLTRLLQDEVLATLMVRQSALVHFREHGQVDVIFSYGIEGVPDCDQLFLVDAPLGTAEDPLPADTPAWVRLIVPLRLNGRTIGCWLWGARDPDDLYWPEDVRTLKILADQTAIALTNIIQAENLHALYRSHIDVREQERTRLARALHDEVLSELAVLNLYVEEAAPPFDKAYVRIGRRLRQTISDLRPAMLNYGLGTAFEEHFEDLRLRRERVGTGAELIMRLTPDTGRYPLHVEGHLFRIVQQALENAIAHAEAATICLEGSLDEEAVQLVVTDDGRGFPAGETFTLPALLAQKHFGLVGMYERAELVGASMTISSTPGEGTRISVHWRTPDAAR